MTDLKIVKLDVPTKGQIAPNNVLDGAPDDLSVVLVLGVEANGEDYFAASTGDVGTVLLLMERLKARFVAGDYNGKRKP